MPDLAEPDDVAEIILRCPTGALHFERTDGGAQEPIPESNRIEIKRNGPFNVSGDTILMDEEGEVLLKDNRISLCRCGKSKNKPLCDGRHFNAGFHHPGIIRDPEKSLRSKRPCKLIVSIQKYGPYLVDGPFELFDGEGHSIFRDRDSLYACGTYKTKPFCDGSHKRRWFFSKRNVRAKRKNSEVTA